VDGRKNLVNGTVGGLAMPGSPDDKKAEDRNGGQSLGKEREESRGRHGDYDPGPTVSSKDVTGYRSRAQKKRDERRRGGEAPHVLFELEKD